MPEGRSLDTRWGEWILFNLPNPSSRTRPWVYSASNRNDYQKQKNNADNLAAVCEPIV
jgi:hypothetical protein